jgi:hypothetical protein
MTARLTTTVSPEAVRTPVTRPDEISIAETGVPDTSKAPARSARRTNAPDSELDPPSATG